MSFFSFSKHPANFHIILHGHISILKEAIWSTTGSALRCIFFPLKVYSADQQYSHAWNGVKDKSGNFMKQSQQIVISQSLEFGREHFA